MPMSTAHLKKHSRNLWFDYLKSKKEIYFIGTVSVFITDCMQVIAARNIGWILDYFSESKVPDWLQSELIRGKQYNVFLVFFLILLGSRIILFLSRMAWRYSFGRQTHRASALLKGKVWDSARFFKQNDLAEKFSKGHLMNVTTSDVKNARFIFGFTLIGLLDFIFLTIVTLFTMLTIHVPLSLWSLVVLLILPYFIKVLSSIEITRYRMAQEFLSSFNDLASQVVATIRLQRMTQTGKFWKLSLDKLADEYRQKRLLAAYTSLRYIPVMGGASVVSYIVLFGIGINYVLDGSMSVGDFVAMQGLIFLLQDPLFELGFIVSEWRKSFASLERLSEVYTQEKDDSLFKDGEAIEAKDIVLKCEDLHFQYPNTERPIFENFNLEISKGERIGLTGPIGSGKSSLVQILSGIERNIGGKLFFQGRVFDSYKHGDLRKYMGVVSQKTFLFADSIRNNINLNQELTDEEIWHFLTMTELKEDMGSFENGLDTYLGEWGINLSGGQKQRLTLARALARKPKVLFLDDCLSAVDTVTEENILQNLNKNLKETTIIWVAHRKSTLKYCNRIIGLSSEGNTHE
jgi:ATP-binding cassette, subfamily B, multidrug efflux pump